MKKIVKKVVAVMLVFTLCGAMFIGDVSALEIHNDSCGECGDQEINSRGLVCTCGGEFFARTVYGELERTGVERRCGHGYPWGTDMQLKRTKTIINKCNGCGLATQNVSWEYFWECHGHR